MDKLKRNIDLVFKTIYDSDIVDDLKKFQPKFLDKYFLNTKKFPKINFSISKNEIKRLGGLNLSLAKLMKKNNLTTLEKLLLSMLWKNGDLGKEIHILEGILDENNIENKSSGIVFYQFGQYLRDSSNQPILDQHIIRSFSFHLNNNKNDIETIKKKSELFKRDAPIIKKYIAWVNEQATRIKGEKQEIFYEIDRLLFALGKYIKKN